MCLHRVALEIADSWRVLSPYVVSSEINSQSATQNKRGCICIKAALTFLEIALDNQLVLLSIPATDDQVVLAGHKPVELLKPVWLAHMLDGGLGAHLAQLMLSLLLCSLEGLLICINSLLLLHQVLLTLLIVSSCVCVRIEVQI